MIDYNSRNEFKYEFRNKKTGRITYFINYCYGNIYEQIEYYRNNLKKMCLLNVSNETHEIIRVTSCMTGKKIWELKE